MTFGAGSVNQARGQRTAGQQAIAQIGATGEQQRTTIGTQTQAETALIQERGRIDLQLQSADAATRTALLNRQGEIDTQLQTLRGQQDISSIQAQGTVQSQLQTERGQIDLQLQTLNWYRLQREEFLLLTP